MVTGPAAGELTCSTWLVLRRTNFAVCSGYRDVAAARGLKQAGVFDCTGIDAQRANDIPCGADEAPASDVVRFPSGGRTGTD
jgi:hypothetical protein